MSSSNKWATGGVVCFCGDEIKSLAFLAAVINCAAEAEIKSEGTGAIVVFFLLLLQEILQEFSQIEVEGMSREDISPPPFSRRAPD